MRMLWLSDSDDERAEVAQPAHGTEKEMTEKIAINVQHSWSKLMANELHPK